MSPEVYISNGLRYIKPYYSSRKSFVKGRWINRTLIDVLSDEFRTNSKEYYLDSISKGNYTLTRGGELIDALSTKIRSGDLLTTVQHKHEPPVKEWKAQTPQNIDGIDIVFEDEKLLVIDKPSGIPVHPTGQYYQNTLTELFKLHNKNCFPCYRLDKVTSGLMIMAKDKLTASEIQGMIKAHTMQKHYLARVQGKFPDSEQGFKMESPIYTVETKRNFPAGLSPSRDAITIFSHIKYFPELNESIVSCKPLTGRTHQIRIHLARLGFPIVNDTIYNPTCTYYPKLVKFMTSFEEWESIEFENLKIMFEELIEENKLRREEKFKVGSGCEECGAVTMIDPLPHELEIWLHAWKYVDPTNTFTFETNQPRWAQLINPE